MNSKSFLYRLKTRYGLTGEQYEDLFQRQHGCCAICLRPSTEFKTKLAVDHDHVSGHIRGLLCNNCNRRVVGRHRREGNAEILLAAYDYLFREYPGWVVPPKIKRKRRKKHVRKIKKNIWDGCHRHPQLLLFLSVRRFPRCMGLPWPTTGILSPPMISTILETYTLPEIIELNDMTEEEVLEYLVVHNVIKLPDIQPLEFWWNILPTGLIASN